MLETFNVNLFDSFPSICGICGELVFRYAVTKEIVFSPGQKLVPEKNLQSSMAKGEVGLQTMCACALHLFLIPKV